MHVILYILTVPPLGYVAYSVHIHNPTHIMKRYENIILVLLICKFSLVFSQNCEIGWSVFGTNCYKVIPAEQENGTNWFDAQKACESLGSNLASIHDMDEQTQIGAIINSSIVSNSSFGPTHGFHIWIGLKRAAPQITTWQWADGTAYNFTDWQKGEPNDADDEACACMYEESSVTIHYQWVDNTCAKLFLPFYLN